MSDKRRYSFIERVDSKEGLRATKLALVSAAMLLFDVVVSFIYDGKAGAYTGAVGITAMLFAVYGFYLGMRSLRERGVSMLYPVIGAISSGGLMLLWLSLFLTGLK